MTNLDTIARTAMNGWTMIPAEPGQKQTYCKWGTVTPENYNFSDLFAGYPIDCNAAILCADTVSVIDFDAHGPEPNGATIYRRLEAIIPHIFHNAIIERTPSNGIHCYFAGMEGEHTYTVSMTVDNVPVEVEILTGRKLSYCSPSTTEKGEYRIISKNNFLNTRPGDLPELPAIFHHTVNPSKPIYASRQAIGSNDITFADVDELIDGLVDSYLQNATEGNRHNHCLGLARALAGHGY